MERFLFFCWTFGMMIDIKSIQGKTLFSVPILADAIAREELMSSDYVQLSWRSGVRQVIPVGSYIIYNGEKYSLLEDYRPTMVNEAEYKYAPQFQSRIMRWQKAVAPVYTYKQDGVSVEAREHDWTFTGTPADAMFIVEQAILNELGEKWSVVLGSDLPSTISLSSQSSSIWAILSDIAEQCNTEWWAEKGASKLHLSKCEYGDPVVLEVGRNIKVPSVTQSTEGFYSRFYAFGSKRNMAQSEGAVKGVLANKRLTLDPKKYPNGYKDSKGHFENGVFVSDLLPEEVFAQTLYFEDIYPSSNLIISGVRRRMRYYTDSDTGEKIRIGGTDEAPEYDMYPIWYFSIEGFQFSEEMVIKGKTLSVHFKSGRLRGREFELAYHSEDRKVADKDDVDGEFSVKAGEYEIIFDEQTEGFLIPNADYIIPENGNEITLFNIELPQVYTDAAMVRLEEELDREIAKRLQDNSSYEFSSNPVAFNADKTNLSLGRKVTFIYGDLSLDTRAMMVEKHLDFTFQQKIRVGNEVIRGSRQQLQDEVKEVGSEVNKMNKQDSYSASVQREHSRELMHSMGKYFAMKDTIEMLQRALDGFSGAIDPITIQTMATMVGDESLQFRFTESRDSLKSIKCPLVYDNAEKMFNAQSCALIHFTLGIDAVTARAVRDARAYKSWDMGEWSSEKFDDPEKKYYVYAVVQRDGAAGWYDYSENPIGMQDNEDVYYFLVGILNAEYGGTREFITLYGFTQILPSQISTDIIESADGSCYFDLANNEIGGRIKFKAGSDEMGGQNMLRNSGFTGDYLSEPLADGAVLKAADKLYSSPFAHWNVTEGVVSVDLSISASGKGAYMASGDESLSQTLFQKAIAGESYVVSFKAKSNEETSQVAVSLGDAEAVFEVDAEWKRYSVKMTPNETTDSFRLNASDVTICEIQLERGSIATQWGNSPFDNSSDRTYYQALQYIVDAIKEGATTVDGGLILTNIIRVGDYVNNVMTKENGGVNGSYANDNSPAFWAGGDFYSAIETAKKYPTASTRPAGEIAFVVTHDGRVILNDAHVRGWINATGGKIAGFTIDGNKIIVSEENNAQLVWDINAGRFFRINGDYDTFLTARNDGKRVAFFQAYNPNGIALSLVGNNEAKAIESYGPAELIARRGETITINGLRLKYRAITASDSPSIDAHDDYVVCNGAVDAYISLPDTDKSGKVLYFTNRASRGTVTLTHENSAFEVAYGHTAMLIFDGTYWNIIGE